MKIKQLRIKNLNSLRLEKTIDFAQSPLGDVGLFAIIGDTGAGKTTILDALTLGLYGKVHRNKDVREVMSYGAVESQSDVVFEANGGLYHAKWRIKRAHSKVEGNIQPPQRELARWNEEKEAFEIIAEKIRDMDAAVEEVTGLDYDRFCRSVLLSQGDFAAFLKANERDRSELLERITGTEIYTRLSRGAYERFKLEEVQLKGKQQELETLKVLTKEEVKTLKEELAKHRAEEQELQKTLNKRRAAIQWLDRLSELEKQQHALEEKIVELQEKEKEAQADFERLKLARQALPFQTKLVQLDDLQQAEEDRQAVLEQLRKDQQLQQKSSEEATASLNEEKKRLAKLQEEWQQKQVVLDQVVSLDIEIREKRGPLQEKQNLVDTLHSEITGLETQKTQLHETIQHLQKENEDLKGWLHDHRHLQQLKEELPTIEYQREEMREMWKAKRQIERMGKADLEKKEQLSGTLAQLDQQQVKLEKEVEALQQKFRETAPQSYAADRSAYLSVLYQEIEQLGEVHKNLEELHRLSSEYQQLLNELSGFEEQLEHLQKEDLDINKQLMNSLDLLDGVTQELEYKQEIYDQQQLIANYEKDRANLKEGDPCPLCLSKEHPFRQMQLKPFVDKARQDLEKARARREEVYENHRKLLRRQNDLEVQIEQLSGNELKQLNGQLARQFEKLLLYEERIASFVPNLTQETQQVNSTAYLAEKITLNEQKVASIKKKRDQLVQLNKALDAKEKAWQEALAQHKEMQMEFRLLEEKEKINQKQAGEMEERFDQLVRQINGILKKYGYTFDLETASGMFEELKKLKEAFAEKTITQEKLAKELELKAVEEKQLADQIARNRKQLKTEEALYQKQAEVVAQLLTSRKELLGEDDPILYRKEMQDQLAASQQALEDLKQTLSDLRIQLESTKKLIREKEQEGKKQTQKIKDLQAELLQLIQPKGFDSLLQLREAILSPEEIETIEHQQKILEQQLLTSRQSLKDTVASLEKEQAKAQTEASLEEEQAALEKAESSYQTLLQSMGAINEKLEQNTQRKKEAQALLKEIDQQKQEFNRWAALNEVIGMADGKKFRIFAQGLTLNKLIQLANRHLAFLNGRYIIQKRSDDDLELEIVDTFQADNRRSMNTLSGGESFLVSLALALGLSDLAGRNTQIKSLFIDEGFGTLDDNSLDLAISTLENLQAAGKSIGVISHVKALKERIGTQIQVHKKGNGVSEIKIVG